MATDKQVEFIIDFASPNAYLAYKVLPDILSRTGARVAYRPALLGGIFKATGNQAPMMAFAGVQGKLAYEQLEFERFIKKHQLSAFKFNPHFPVMTLFLMRGAMVAERDDRLEEYIAAGFHHMWEDPKKMDDPDAFVTAMTSSGFDGAALLEQTKDSAVKQLLMEKTNAVIERGVFGIPTFFIGKEMFFGKDRLDQVEEALSN